MAAWTINRWKSDLIALEESIERAGLALGCSYSSYEEYEAAMLRARHYRQPLGRRLIEHMRLILGVTAGLCAVALLILAL